MAKEWFVLRRLTSGAAVISLVAITLGACGGGGSTASGGGTTAGSPTQAAGAATIAPTQAAGAATTAPTQAAGAAAATPASGGTTAAATGNADAGKQVFDSSGCSACHTIKGQGGKVGPELTAVGTRLSQQQIIDQLKDPKQRPAPYTQITSGAVMPKPNLTDAQINDLSAYLEAQKG